MLRGRARRQRIAQQTIWAMRSPRPNRNRLMQRRTLMWWRLLESLPLLQLSPPVLLLFDVDQLLFLLAGTFSFGMREVGQGQLWRPLLLPAFHTPS